MKVAYIHTSDRILFKRCRRRWGWMSPLKGNLAISQPATYFWLGQGIHFGLEDFHGYDQYGSPRKALEAFCDACRRTPRLELPDDWEEALELGQGMMDYYLAWLENRDPLKTLWIDGVPQVEVPFEIPLPDEIARSYGYDKVFYAGTFDRVATDEFDLSWLVDYKSAIQFQTGHFPTDSQVGSYIWAGSSLYDRPFQGLIYQQHRKALPVPPPTLQSGRISTNKSQNTTRILYREALLNLYGAIEKAPAGNVEFLNRLAMEEFEEADRFIRRDRISRNAHSVEAEGVKILLEAEEMLNPDLPLYPNPTRDCSWDCPLLEPCISLDDGSDWEASLKGITQPRLEARDEWRANLQA